MPGRLRTRITLGHEYQFSGGCGAFEQLVSLTCIRQRQALGNDRVNLAVTKQLEQRAEVLPVPILVRVAQLLDPVREHPSARREQSPEHDECGAGVPLEYSWPILAPVRD